MPKRSFLKYVLYEIKQKPPVSRMSSLSEIRYAAPIKVTFFYSTTYYVYNHSLKPTIVILFPHHVISGCRLIIISICMSIQCTRLWNLQMCRINALHARTVFRLLIENSSKR